jgi:hypothetical protein
MSEQSSGLVGSNDRNGAANGTASGQPLDTSGVAAVNDIAGGDKPKRAGGWPKGKPRSGNNGSDSAGSGSGGSSASSARTSGKKTEALDLSGIEAALVGIHAGIAMLTKNPIWEMQEAEAASVAKATANVARHYPKLAGHEKLVDWIMLIQTVGMIYGPRFYLSMPEKKAETKTAPPSNLTVFPSGAL